jgi:hypothetical protein
VQWEYGTRAVDPACTALLPDPGVTSAALKDYVYERPVPAWLRY